MTAHEQVCFNDAAVQVQAYEWRDRTIRRLLHKLEPLSAHDKIALLRKIDELID